MEETFVKINQIAQETLCASWNSENNFKSKENFS